MKLLNLRKIIAAFIFVLLFVGIIFVNNSMSNKKTANMDRAAAANDSDLIVRESADIAKVQDQFKMGNKDYIVLPEALRKEFKLPETISTEHIGNRIITIENSVDDKLKDREVFQYIPAGSEAVVAVKMDKEYTLFKFFTFDSYNNNQDEDARAYLELYGINQGKNILKVQIIGHSDEAKIQGRLDIISEITDREKINEFYNYYSVIKNSSDKYFDRLFNYKGSDNQGQVTAKSRAELTPPDSPDGAATSGSAGSVGDALNNPVTIRIYNQSGLYYDAEYYPNLSFISRHEVNEEFVGFLKGYMKQ